NTASKVARAAGTAGAAWATQPGASEAAGTAIAASAARCRGDVNGAATAGAAEAAEAAVDHAGT
ncbi:hypothetical protein, partial [Mycobacterium tuberculosis]|uniref:hypothetical protein n=1 Tax=Mycobacterium tuberculosis TaxID=1773 RepID=UPI003C6E0435